MQLGDTFCIVEQVTEVLQPLLLSVKDKAGLLSASKCCTLGENNRSLLPVHQKLLCGQNKSKVPKDDSSSDFYKVVMCPEIFFSDDTAGGNSKQFLPYESWSMVHAALPYEDRARRENTKYLRCVPKSEGLSSMSFIPSIAADLKMLKRGVKMHSSVFVEIVIVKAPVMFIVAENTAHSNICGLLQQTTLYACRKCYFEKLIRRQKPKLPLLFS